MPYRDAPFVDDYRERPSSIYAPLLPRTPALIAPGTPPQKQATTYAKLTAALHRVVDPGGMLPPLTIALSQQAGAYLAEVTLPSVLPKAPPSFWVRLSETSEVSRLELLRVGVVLRNGWAEYFASLEKARFLYRQALLANDALLQARLAAGLSVPCPRCGEALYTRAKPEAMKLHDLPVPLLRTRETCSGCHLVRLFDELRCRRCPGLLLPKERIHTALSESSEPQLAVRESQHWRCQLCHDELVSSSFRSR